MIPLGVLAAARVAPAAPGGGFTFQGGKSGIGDGTATHTAQALDFGAAAANRVLVAAISTRVSSGRSVTGVTIGGVAATIDVVSGTWPTALIARATVPTGTSGDVVLTYSGNEFGPIRCALYRTVGAVTKTDGQQAYNSGGTVHTVTLAPAAGNSLIAVAGTSAAGRTWAWSNGLAVDYAASDASNSSGSMTHTDGLAGGALTLTSTMSAADNYSALAAVTYAIT